jgi:hypothetical protein
VREELRPGLWTWTAPHPSWTPDEGGPEGWEQEVRSYALDTGEALVLFDPLVEVAEAGELAAGRQVVVLLTCRWHKRSCADLVEQLGATVRAPGDTMAELGVPALPYEIGDDLPGDVESQVGGNALITGDVLLGGESGFRVQPDSWLAEGLTREGLRDRLRPLLKLPIELLLPTHGDPVVEDAHDMLSSVLAS